MCWKCTQDSDLDVLTVKLSQVISEHGMELLSLNHKFLGQAGVALCTPIFVLGMEKNNFKAKQIHI